ncbi:MAG: hypothetical protein A2V66_05525 [Ignavibacteria bacterium RBG_13_36_8]|nr:MAG: hypothetical protein A2V66_05525 [Ignavibacteria bacterium RBG_13_36_8]
MEQSEKLLVAQIIKGDKETFRILINRYKRLVFHIVFRLVSNKTEREDLGQEIFIKVYESLSSFKYQCSLATWISRIAHNTCFNYLKKKKVYLYEDQIQHDVKDTDPGSPFDNIVSSTTPQDEAISEDEISKILNKEVHKLPALYREIISLYYLEQLNYKEISIIVNLPEGTIKSYMFRARAILKDRLLTKYQVEEL